MSPLSGISPRRIEGKKLESESEALIQESLRVSHEIDGQLLETKIALEKKAKSIQILLLGQSESGKSAILKNFHLAFAPQHFHSERIVWKTIVQLNLIGSLRMIVDILQEEWEATAGEPTFVVDRNLKRICLGLSPLLFFEANIIQVIAPETKDLRDFCVRPGSNWKPLLMTMIGDPPVDTAQQKHRSQNPMSKDVDPTSVLAASKEDILLLWHDPGVQALLKKRGIRTEDIPGFFLSDIERIATLEYVPTDSDIMKARMRTVGAQDHRFVIEKGFDVGSEVYITDVGGSRSQRPKWIPYFQDVQTIIFLAPLAFNQTLEEDPEVNRLEDSLMLWKEICKNPLLAKAMLILFFNKKDVLRSTLAAGVKVRKYVPSYGDRPNDLPSVTKYFCEKFRTYHRKLSSIPRPFAFHESSAIDTRSMATLLLQVRDTILHIYLRQGEMI